MRYPYIEKGTEPYQQADPPIDDTCPTTPTTVTLSNGYKEWVCTFGSLTPGTPGVEQLVVSVVWQVPTPPDASVNCPTGPPANEPGCLVSNGRWTVNEGLNDQSDPNDAFPPGGKDVRAAMLAAGTQSQELKEAGGYELPSNCTDPLGQGSLRTKQVVSLDNKVSTTICLPTFETADADDAAVGPRARDHDRRGATRARRTRRRIRTRTVEGLHRRPRRELRGRGQLHAVPVHAGEPGEVRLPDLERRARGARQNNERSRSTSRRSSTTACRCPAQCPSARTLNGCYTSIKENKQGKNKFWVIEAQAPGNGLWGW